MPGARPALHFTAGSGWINDPLGLTHRDGVYHLWFQHVPGAAEWGPACSWGHAISPDLLTWSEGATALAPGDGDGGCWSGSVVTGPDGAVRVFYTSVAEPDLGVGRVRTARPADGALTAWRKDPGSVVEPPPGVRARQFRDPYVFAEDGRWWMLVGAGLDDGTATALTWVSDDLRSWTWVGPLAARHRDETDPVWTGAMWECPQLVRVGDRHLLVVSVWADGELHSVACAVGRFTDGRFTAASWHRIGWGAAHYAASAFRDRGGRPGLVFWLRGIADPAGGWTGATSLPYLLGLDGDRPVLTPHDALAARRTAPQPATALDAAWRPAAGGDELRLVGADGAPVARLRWDGGRVLVDDGAALPHPRGDLRLVLDGPVLEVCGPGGVLAVPVPAGLARPVGDGDLTWWALDA
ncbi:glycoside hydrolase family 32 protein [Geodermatophilus sp. SYSU D00815]